MLQKVKYIFVWAMFTPNLADIFNSAFSDILYCLQAKRNLSLAIYRKLRQ